MNFVKFKEQNGAVERRFQKFGKDVRKRARQKLTSEDRNVSKSLYNSIEFEVITKPESVSVEFSYDRYGDYQDQGIKGRVNASKAPKSPFKYKKMAASPPAILRWVQARRFQFRDRKTGRFMSYQTTGFLISRSIARDGIAPMNWFTGPLEEQQKKLNNDILLALEFDIRNTIDKLWQSQ